MNIRLITAAALALAAAPARALTINPAGADVRVSEQLVDGGGRYFGQDFEAGGRFPTGRWDISVRAKSFQSLDDFSGTQAEYSARLSRLLPHVSVAGRLGTSPPGGQGLAYHLVGGEVLLSMYGLELGPEDPAHYATVAEDTTTAAEQAHLDQTWVTRMRMFYTNTDFDLAKSGAPGGPILIQNAWRFAFSETWRKTAAVELRIGGERYGRLVTAADPAPLLWNVDDAAAPLPVRGWTKNDLGGGAKWDVGNLGARAAVTRHETLFSGDEWLIGADALWRPGGGALEARAGWCQRREERGARDAVWLSVSRRW